MNNSLSLRREKPKRPLKKVLSQMRMARNVTAVKDHEAIKKFGHGDQKFFSEIILTTWNIWKGAGEEFFKRDFLKLAQQSNLILIQEALLTPVNEQIFLDVAVDEKLSISHAASYIRQDGCVEGVMTLSKVETSLEPARILCERPEFLLKTFKTALVTTYPFQQSKNKLKVINLHARLLRGPKTAATDLDFILKKMAVDEHSGPIIVAGDFNTFSRRHLETISAVLLSHNIKRVPIKDDPRIPRESLDQIFIRGLKVIKIKIDTSIKSSDHFPLICHLRPE